MKISRNDCSAALFLFLAGVGPLAAMTEPCLPLPNQLTVTFEYATTLDLSNVNVATSENGAFNFTNIETPEPLFLPSPPLAGLASQLSSCQAEIVIGGSSVLPGEQTPVELNDKDFLLGIDISIDFDESFGCMFCSCGAIDISRSIDGGHSYVEIDSEDYGCSVSETFDNVRLPIMATGLEDPSSPPLETGFRIVLTAVPVPPAFLLFGSALGLLGWIRSRHRV